MNTHLKIKVCGMRQAQNLESLLQLYPDFVGFIFHPGSPRYVADGNSIGQLSFGSTKKVGVFVNEKEEIVRSKAMDFSLDYLQLHGDENPAYCEKLKALNLKLIKVFRVDEGFDFKSIADFKALVDYFLFDTKVKEYGGMGKQFDWDILQGYRGDKPFFLSGGIRLKDITRVLDLELPSLVGIDVNSGFEEAPALKDIELIKKAIKQIRL